MLFYKKNTKHNMSNQYDYEGTKGNWWKWVIALLLFLIFIWFMLVPLTNTFFNGNKNNNTAQSSSSSSSSMSSSAMSSSSAASSMSSSSSSMVKTPEVVLKSAGIIDALKATGKNNTLVAAIEASGLKDTLDMAGKSYTIFAPTDAALVPYQATVDTLLKPENKAQLQDFLKGHVLTTKNSVAEFTAGKADLKTLSDKTVSIKLNENGFGTILGGKETVIAPDADIVVGETIIHTTDKPLTF
jgi:uncharacterized surface protein with fasciclin (FAS1) repeats